MKEVKSIIRQLRELDLRLSFSKGKMDIAAIKGKISNSLFKQILEHEADLGSYFEKAENSVDFSPISTVPLAESYPVSPAQRRLWISSQAQGAQSAYNMPSVYLFSGTLDIMALENAFNLVINRHESLRTVFRETADGEVRQWILSPEDFKFEIRTDDLSGIPNAMEIAPHFVKEAFAKPFDLANGPLLRASLFKIDVGKWIFVFVMHHIVSDGWSMEVLVKDLLSYYTELLTGNVEIRSELKIQYKDFSSWQNEQLSGEQHHKHRDYWMRKLGGVLPVIALPGQKRRPSNKTYCGEIFTGTIEAATCVLIKSLGVEHRATLFITLLAAVKALVSRYTKQEDIIIGSPIAGRDYADVQNQIGFYVNTLALRTKFTGTNSFRELIELVRETTLEAHRHQIYPFDELVEDLMIDRDMSRNPLFDIQVIVRNADSKKQQIVPEGIGLSLESYKGIDTDSSVFDLVFDFIEAPDGLHYNIIYNSDIYDRAVVEMAADHLAKLLTIIGKQPDIAINSINLLHPGESDRLLGSLNGTATAAGDTATLNNLFLEQSSRTPNAPAVIFGSSTLTFRELEERSSVLCRWLLGTGKIGPESLVGIMLDRSEHLIVTILGILRSGCAYVPIDPTYPSSRKLDMFRDAECEILVTQTDYLFDLDYFDGEVFAIDIQLDQVETADYLVPVTVAPNQLAYVIYTSGSTGEPKGVMVEHRSIVNTILAQVSLFGVKEGERNLQFATPSFDASVSEIFVSLLSGGALYIVDEETRRTPSLLSQFIKDNEIKIATLPPVYLHQMEINQLSGLRCLVTAGEAADAEDANLFLDLGMYVNAYGPTESSVCATALRVSKGGQIVYRNVPIGSPITNTRVYILDDAGRLLPTGVIGEIFIAGAGLARGYWRRPDLSSEKFMADPFKEGSRMYRSGDMGRWLPGGTLEFLGRNDSQVKVRGFRVELGEVEAMLSRYPPVESAAVIARPSSTGSTEIIAYTVSKGALNQSEIRAWLGKYLPEYMIPAHFVQLDSMPMTNSGKIDRRALPEHQMTNVESGVSYLGPRNEFERKLAIIWEEILARERVGVKDNFFNLGGHSLKATRLVGQINKVFGVKIELKDLFSYTILEEQAKLIEDAAATSYSVIPKVDERGGYVLSSSQRRLWILNKLEPNNTAYNMPGSSVLEGELKPIVLEAAFRALLQRHESLRTVFREAESGEVLQDIMDLDKVGFTLNYVDFTRELSPQAHIQERIQAECQEVFDLSKGPLLRASLYRIREDKWILNYVVHHIITDGWSMDILIRELLVLYNAECKGLENPLEPLPIQYKDYAAWQQNELLGSDRINEHKTFWMKQFAGSIPTLDLPGFQIRPAIKTYSGAKVSCSIDRTVRDSIRRLSVDQGGTMFIGLLGILNTLLYRYTQETDIVVGTSVSSREHPDIQNQIGFYVNTLALRTNVNPSDSYRELLDKVKEVVFASFEHQVYPFDDLVAQLNLQRDRGRHPLFDVMMVLQTLERKVVAGYQDLSDLRVWGYEGAEHIVSKFDLTFFFTDADDELRLQVVYNKEIFSQAMVNKLMEHFKGLMTEISEDPNISISKLTMLSEEEKANLLDNGRSTNEPLQNTFSIIEKFEEQVDKWPERIAVVFDRTSLTFQELDDRSNRLANYLRTSCNVQRDDFVGILLERSEHMIVALIGILKAGAAYVPLDAESPRARTEFIILETKMKVLITQSIHLFNLDYFNGNLFAIDIQLEGLGFSGNRLEDRTREDDLAYAIYTSGTTGQPKGVLITHRAIIDYHLGLIKNSNIASCQSFGLVSTLSADLGNTVIFPSLLTGGCLHVFSTQDIVDSDRMSQTSLDCVKIVPGHWNALQRGLNGFIPTKCLIFGGERLTLQTLELLRSKQATCEVYNHYGPSETTIGKLINKINLQGYSVTDLALGKPFGNTQIYILDDSDNLVPSGVPGQICIAGDGLARGYLQQPALTFEKFVSDPFNHGHRLYRTGDWGRWLADGSVDFIGRKDSQVKIRGYRIELGEIESALKQFTEVVQVAVLAHSANGGDPTLTACLVGAQNIPSNELTRRLKDILPIYMIPQHFRWVEALPLTSNGKLDRKALMASVINPVMYSETHVEPRNETEVAVARIWREILQIESVGVKDDFFVLGGHSLAATRLASLIHKTFDVKLDFFQLFTNVTIEDQALLIDNSIKSVFLSIPVANEKNCYPLSSPQRRLWILQQLAQDNLAYHMTGNYSFTGDLNPDTLEKAFHALIRRHEILRTVFRADETGNIMQWILSDDNPVFQMKTVDIRDKEDVTKTLLQLVQSEEQIAFDLGQAPLLRATLYHKADNEWIFFYVMHHIIGDGWSMSILVNELFALYKIFANKTGSDLTPLSLQYRDFAVWQQGQLTDGILAEQRMFWLKTLEGPFPALSLPLDFSRPAVKTFRGGTVDVAIEKSTRDGLLDFCLQRNSTLFIGLVAALNATLYKYSGNTDILIGCPVAGRQHADLAGQIGFYVNTLALRTTFSSAGSFEDLHAKVKKAVIDAFDHQLYPFDELVGELPGPHDKSRSPLFDVLIDFHETGDGFNQTIPEHLTVKMAGLSQHSVSKFDLTFMFIASETELILSIEFNSDLFLAETVKRISAHFIRLLNLMISEPQQTISRAQFIDQVEWNELILRYNDLPTTYAEKSTVVDLFTEQVSQYPDNFAIRFGELSLTYRELEEQANRLANHLRDRYQLGTGDLVGILQDRSEKMIVSILAVLKTGAAYVPVDPFYPQKRKEFIFKETEIKVLLTQTDYIFSLPDFTGNLLAVDIELESLVASSAAPALAIGEEALSYVIYTSGSTGTPKGCAITHKGLVNYIQWANGFYFSGSEKPCFGLYTSLSFDLTVTAIFCALTTGGSLYIYRQEEELAAILMHSFSSSSEINSIKITPSHIAVLQTLDLSSGSMLRAIVGGEQLNTEHVEVLRKSAPGIRVFNEYGPTEATVGNIVMEIGENSEVRIGKPIPKTSVYILDDNMSPSPIGVAGELYISGAGLARNYLNQPELTNARFIDNPFRPGSKMYKTGDIGRWHTDGNIEYMGRIDRQLKVRGYRIEPGEIEAMLLLQAQIREVLVTVSSAGDLVAYLIGAEELNVVKVKDELAKNLPAFMIPTYFVPLQKWPYTVNGKLDKSALPDPASGLAGKEYVAPSTQIEEKLVRIWEEIFRMERVGMKDDFFDLGGHSLKATRLAARIHKEFDIKVELRDLFEVTVVEDQAKFIEQLKTAQFVEIPLILSKNGYELSSSQKRLWVLSQFEEISLAYHIHVAYLFTGNLNIPAFECALFTLVERHESLRTVFREDANGLVKQHILPASKSGYELVFTDLRSQGESMTFLKRTIAEFLKQPFDLGNGPLARWALYRTADDKWAFACAMHHIITDGWSMRVLFGELLDFYRACCEERQHDVAPLRIQYKDYAAWQQGLLTGPGMIEERDYWLRQLGGDLPVLDLPGENKRPTIKTYNGRVVRSVIPASIIHELKSLSHAHGSTFFIGLLSVVNALLYKYTRQKDIVIGTLVAGRDHADLERQIGFYVNTLALRFQFDDTDTMQTLMGKTKEVVLDAYRHQHYPFDELVNALQIRRDMSRSVLFDVMVVLHNEDKGEQSQFKSADGLSVTEFGDYERQNSKFDLTFNFVDRGEDVQLDIEYNQDIYGLSFVEQFVRHFAQIASSLLQQSKAQLRYIDFLNNSERKVLLEQFNDVHADSQSEGTVHRMFEEMVHLKPTATALLSGGMPFSFVELNVQANRLAHYLQDRYALRPDDRVGIKLPHNHWIVISILAVLKAGAAYVPVDPDYPQERIDFIKEDSSWKALVDENEIERFLGEEYEYDPKNGPAVATGANLAYVIYTSGSTGKPKGVMVEHRNVVSFLSNFKDRLYIQEGMSMAATTSYSFDISVIELVGSLVSGLKLIMLPGKDPVSVVQRIKDYKVDILQVTPSWLNQMLESNNDNVAALAGLKVLLVGGEALGERNFQRLKGLRETRVISVYGPTETTIWSSALDVHSSNFLSLGRPLENETIDIRDNWQNLMPIGVVGEICIGGCGISRGYLHKPELTSQKFISDLVREGHHIYRTGDLGRWRPDGTIEFFGRMDDQMKINGYRIEPGEIESVINCFPGIAASVVTAVPDERGNNTLVAFTTGQKTIDTSELRAFLSSKLPIHLLPLHYISLEALPLNTSGKVDKKRLPDLLSTLVQGGVENLEPANEVEAQIAAIWNEILLRHTVGMRDNFFLLGGNSLKAIRMLTKLRAGFDVEIKIIEIFNNPTIESLAREIVRKIWVKRSAVVGEDENIIVTI